MDKSFYIEIMHNVVILLCFILLYNYIWLKFEKPSWKNKIFAGLLLSLFITVLMFNPAYYSKFIFFDLRSVLLSISGLFFGFIPTILTAITAITVRIIQGGEGMYMGLAVILTSSAIGLLWRYFRPQWEQKKYVIELLCLGVLVHFIMALCVVFLPSGKEWLVLKHISLPLFFIYIPATVLLGMLMVHQHKNWLNRKAKEKLIETEYILQQVFQNNHIYMVFTDVQYMITSTNQYFTKSSEFSDEELKQKNIRSFLFQSSENTDVVDFLKRLPSDNFVYEEIESEFTTKSNKKHFVLWFVSKTVNYAKVNNGFVLIGIDITQRNLRIQMLTDMNQKLESQYEILQEMNNKLNEANQKAEANAQFKSLLLSNLSHEIRTPMNAIVGFSDLLQNETNEEKIKQFSEIIAKSARQLLQTIDDIVEVSKLQSHKEKLMLNTVNPAYLINECILMRQFNNQKPDIPLKIVYDNTYENFLIKTDENKLKQILINLLSNAVNYTQQGEIEIGFMIENGNIIFFVKDTGVGISPKDIDHIFETFYRGESAKKNAIKGLGLGLSIVKELVSLLHGTIAFESEVNKGTSFFVKLPIEIL